MHLAGNRKGKLGELCFINIIIPVSCQLPFRGKAEAAVEAAVETGVDDTVEEGASEVETWVVCVSTTLSSSGSSSLTDEGDSA